MNYLPMKKTNAIRLLEKENVSFQTLAYDYNPDFLDVGKIAKDNDLPVALVYKTLVAIGDNKALVIAAIPGHKQLNLKALARMAGFKKAGLLPTGELLEKTGYIRGGCSPIGLKKPFPIFIDDTALKQSMIYVNAGQRGLLLQINPTDLAKVTNATFGQIILPELS